MTNAELLVEVKKGLSRSGTVNDGSLLIKVIGTKEYILGSGVSQEQLETQLGIATLTIGVSDLWSLEPGLIKFSPVFNNLVTQLAGKSLE